MIEGIDVSYILNTLNITYEKRGGRYTFQCINPSHIDKHPSMNMNEEGLYRCWSCGEKGNISTFIWNLTEKSVEDFLGIKDKRSFYFKSTLTQKTKEPTEVEQRKLYVQGDTSIPYANEEVMSYLRKISINDQFIKHFGVRYTEYALIRFFKSVKFTTFKKRLYIPVVDTQGKTVNIIGRDYTEKQTPKELYPSGSVSDIFFNYNDIDLTKPVVVVEGMKGLVRVWRYFNKNVMSSFGSGLGNTQLEVLAKIPRLLLFVDNDAGGKKMIDQVEKVREKEYSVTWMTTPAYDPADGSLQELEDALTHPIESVDYYLSLSGIKKQKHYWS